mmetsp:Transcript_60008/g.139791  ORF Transcript_60008/g.139791 Transcript_60008/m.139791 type:complete len:259 (+) Transcript_60008:1175-1951(+)
MNSAWRLPKASNGTLIDCESNARKPRNPHKSMSFLLPATRLKHLTTSALRPSLWARRFATRSADASGLCSGLHGGTCELTLGVTSCRHGSNCVASSPRLQDGARELMPEGTSDRRANAGAASSVGLPHAGAGELPAPGQSGWSGDKASSPRLLRGGSQDLAAAGRSSERTCRCCTTDCGRKLTGAEGRPRKVASPSRCLAAPLPGHDENEHLDLTLLKPNCTGFTQGLPGSSKSRAALLTGAGTLRLGEVLGTRAALV